MSPATRQRVLYVVLALFAGGLVLSWMTHGTGVVRDDPDRNISIPPQLSVPLQVQVAYNDADVFFRYRWPAERPGLFHDTLTFDNGAWVRKGQAVPGSNPDGLHEDRVAMMLDDGSVPEFSRYGGYLAIGTGILGFTGEVHGDEIAAHPHLGKTLKFEEISKHLPETRSDINDWQSVQSVEVLAQQRAAGYFLDLWHWRSHRSNPINMSDDQFIAEKRGGDTGRSAAGTNWDGATKQPRFMFDAAATGYKALNWDDVRAGRVSQESVYYLLEGQAVPFDPDAGWQNGDTLPRRYLREPQGSLADIAVHGEGRWADGFWDVTLQRKLDTGNPQDDKILRHLGAYAVAFSIHRDATGGRWHYVSLPYSLGLGRSGDIVATRFAGDSPAWGNGWTDITLFYPGQVSWPHLNSTRHAGAKYIRAGQPVTVHHSIDQLKHYGIEAEFADEIRRQWGYTLLAGLALIAAFGFALSKLFRHEQGA